MSSNASSLVCAPLGSLVSLIHVFTQVFGHYILVIKPHRSDRPLDAGRRFGHHDRKIIVSIFSEQRIIDFGDTPPLQTVSIFHDILDAFHTRCGKAMGFGELFYFNDS